MALCSMTSSTYEFVRFWRQPLRLFVHWGRQAPRTYWTLNIFTTDFDVIFIGWPLCQFPSLLKKSQADGALSNDPIPLRICQVLKTPLRLFFRLGASGAPKLLKTDLFRYGFRCNIYWMTSLPNFKPFKEITSRWLSVEWPHPLTNFSDFEDNP